MQTVAATAGLVPALLAAIGPLRVATLERLAQASAVSVLEGNIAASLLSWCGVDDAGGVVTMGGVIPTGGEWRGHVWQIIADISGPHRRDYIRQGRAMVAVGRRLFRCLVVIIEADDPAAVRHAGRAGFISRRQYLRGGISGHEMEIQTWAL